jgi:2-oxoglutarate dehydrogenase complex dehydrogenase (E1) component-like enzyme
VSVVVYLSATVFSHASLRSVSTQVNGHSLANLDPLGLDNRPAPIELDPALYGFTEEDLDTPATQCTSTLPSLTLPKAS